MNLNIHKFIAILATAAFAGLPLAIIKRELNSWKMAFVEAGALFALAYVATLIVYQLGSVFEIGTRMLQ